MGALVSTDVGEALRAKVTVEDFAGVDDLLLGLLGLLVSVVVEGVVPAQAAVGLVLRLLLLLLLLGIPRGCARLSH